MKKVFLALTALCMLGLVAQAQMSVSTADGSGADTFVGNDTNKPPTSNYGAGSTMDIRNYTGVRAHIGYVRFDISCASGANLTGAQLQLYITSAAASRTWNIYGLTDNSADDAWGEMTITYNNAPGMLPAASGSYAIDPAKLTLLGTLAVTSGSNYSLTSSTATLNLDSFLASDTNGLVTFVLIGPNNGDGSQYYAAAKEGVAAPVLILPNASNVQAANLPLPDGSGIESATDVTLSWRPGQSGGAADPSITGYYLYMAPFELVCDPGTADFSTITPIYVPRGAGARDQYPASGPGLAFGECQAVYWRVDESVNGSQATDPDTVVGSEWRFETEGTPPPAIRSMEYLGRGVVAVRTGSGALISWRLLGLDPAGIGFNVYRSAAGGAGVKLNASVLTDATCYTDTTANFTVNNAWYVKPVVGGDEQAASASFTLTANHPAEPRVVIPLSGGSTGPIHFVWVGDLDGDGEYDYVVDRLNYPNPQAVEAYRRDGTRLWSVNMGPNSTNTDNIEPGSSCIDVGHWDGVTVYDLDSDGAAEVAIRTANGVTFGDGSTLVNANNNIQFISVLDGMTGAERTRIQIPTDYIVDGPLGAQFGVGYLNGRTPSLVAVLKNRIGDGDFNMMVCAWDFDGSSLTQKWKWLRGSQNCADGHNIRIVDVDGDDMDEVCEIGFVLDSNGTLLYNLADSGVNHGDRWHIGKFDQSRPGLQGYGIQQSNPSGLREYYYDAGTGELLWTSIGAVADMARGDAGDIDPRYAGFECWSFDGVWNGPTGNMLTSPGVEPYPVIRLWWDGDELSESYNDGKIEEWNYTSSSTSRLVTTWDYDTYTRSDRGCPMFYGDIFGDWREEVVMTNANYTALGIFTANSSTSRRIYTLPHNPEYRNSMTVKGYMQSHQVDYYLGNGMSTPPTPNIVLVGSAPDTTPPAAPTGLVATAGDATVALNWADNTEPDLASYNVYRSMSSGHSYGAIATDVALSSYTDNTAQNGTAYYYVVTAVDTSSNESAYSNEVSAAPQSMTPTFVAAGSVASGTGTITPALPSGIASGDILLLFVETANQAVSISNPNGGTWAAVTGSPQGTGTAGGTSAARLTVFWSRYNGSQGAPAVSDSGNHQIARMIAVRGAVAAGNPWDVTAGGVEATSDTSGSIPGATTTVANTLVVVAVAGSLPDANGTANFSAWSNADLTNLIERTDDTRNVGNGGALGIATGVKAAAGAYGNTTVTHAGAAVKGMVSIAIRK